MAKIGIILTVIGLVLSFFYTMFGLSEEQKKQNRVLIIGARILLFIAVAIGVYALRLPTEKAAPSTQQGNCSTTGNVAGNFSPNCNNQ